jgi:hypothetical protein
MNSDQGKLKRKKNKEILFFGFEFLDVLFLGMEDSPLAW